MLAEQCRCERPLTFDPPACSRCGRETAQPISASTWRLALAIAEVALGYRMAGDSHSHSKTR